MGLVIPSGPLAFGEKGGLRIKRSSAAAVPTLPFTTGLAAQFMANAITGKTDGQTTEWVDSSGNGKDATNATAGQRPLYKTGILNGLPVCRFVRASSNKLTSTFENAGAALSVFIVAKFTGTTANCRIAEWGGGKAGVAYNATGPQFGYWADAGAAAYVNFGGTPSAFTLLEIVYTDVTSAQLYVKGVAAGAAFNPHDDYVNAVAGTTLGWEGTTTSADCDIAEVLFYTAALNTTNRQTVENYLVAKYAL